MYLKLVEQVIKFFYCFLSLYYKSDKKCNYEHHIKSLNKVKASWGSSEAVACTAFAASTPSSSSASNRPFSEELRDIWELLQPPLPKTDESVACSRQLHARHGHSCRCRPRWRWWRRPSACGQRGWWTRGCSCSSNTPPARISFLECQECLAAFSNGKARQQLIQFSPARKYQTWFDFKITFHCLWSSYDSTKSAQELKSS